MVINAIGAMRKMIKNKSEKIGEDKCIKLRHSKKKLDLLNCSKY